MAGFPKFKFSIFTLTIVFALLAASSSSEFDDFEEELRGEDDPSDEAEEDERHHYQWKPQMQHYHVHHYPRHPQYPQAIKMQMHKCNNLPQCKPCKAPTVPSYQPKPPSARRVQRSSYLEENQFEQSLSEDEYETRYHNSYQNYYRTTQPPRPRQCGDVCKESVPVTKKPYVPVTSKKPYQQYRPSSGYGR